MNSRPPITTFTQTGSESPRRPADFLQPLARRVDRKPMMGTSTAQQETRRLAVARGITLRGEVAGCQRLIVEGEVEASVRDCQVLEVAEHGSFSGAAAVEQADIRGRVDGELTVLGRLIIRSTGRVVGRIRYRDLSIEQGGKLAGQIDTLDPEEAPDVVEPSLREVSPPAELAPAVPVSPATPAIPAAPAVQPSPPRFALASSQGDGVPVQSGVNRPVNNGPVDNGSFGNGSFGNGSLRNDASAERGEQAPISTEETPTA